MGRDKGPDCGYGIGESTSIALIDFSPVLPYAYILGLVRHFHRWRHSARPIGTSSGEMDEPSPGQGFRRRGG